jgi:hypothetical protein
MSSKEKKPPTLVAGMPAGPPIYEMLKVDYNIDAAALWTPSKVPSER